MILKFRALVWACVCVSLQTLRVLMALCTRWSNMNYSKCCIPLIVYIYQKSWALLPRGAREVWGDAYEGKTGGGSQLIFDKPSDNRTVCDSFPSKRGNIGLWDLGTCFPCPVLWESWSFISFLRASSMFFCPFDTKIAFSTKWRLLRRSVESPLSSHFSAWTPRKLTSDQLNWLRVNSRLSRETQSLSGGCTNDAGDLWDLRKWAQLER